MRDCRFCANQGTDACETCNEKEEHFYPKKEVAKYYQKGSMGLGRYCFHFDTTNEELTPTHSVDVDGHPYCPYCGGSMFPIQKKEIHSYGYEYPVTGYCCICPGAQAELEYEKELEELNKQFENERAKLQDKYAEKLKFDSAKLFAIKQRIEKERFEFFDHQRTHFTTINGRKVTGIDDLI